MLFGWAAHETWSGVKTIHSAYTGELQRDMVDQFVDQFQSGYELGGGHGPQAIGMGFSAVALALTQPIFNCVDALANGGSRSAISSNCGQTAAMFVPLGRCATIGRGVRVAEAGTEATGQLHHVISTRIGRELERNPNLAGRYSPRDPRFTTRAVDDAAHRGYQTWHRELDAQVEGWLRANRNATPQQFESFLSRRYSQSDLQQRFPNGF